MEPIGECLAIIRGAERHGDLLAAEPVDGFEAPLNRWVGVHTFDGTETFHKVPTIMWAERWPPGLNRLREIGIALARATVDRRQIGSNGFYREVELPCRGLQMRCEIGHRDPG